MTAPETIPVAWLHPFPDDYRPPLWRWLLLPATTFMAHRDKGVWISGNLTAAPEGLSFAPGKVGAKVNRMAVSWSLRWDEIRDLGFSQGFAMDRIEVHHPGGVHTLQSARSAAFFARVNAAIERPADPAP